MKAVIFMLSILSFSAMGQSFGDRCQGVWNGTMYMYSKGVLRDSAAVRFTVVTTSTANTWVWKTEYLSAKRPMVKDYLLRLMDAARGLYVVDEGGGVELTGFYFGNKLYSVFETEGVFLTSSYELFSDHLIFEVTSGKKEPSSSQNLFTYSVDHLQRVVLRRD